MEKRKGLKKESEGALIPANVDPIKLADEIKRGMGKIVLERYKKLKKSVLAVENK